jgi:peptidoglycan hydrolase CwlO-like protein
VGKHILISSPKPVVPLSQHRLSTLVGYVIITTNLFGDLGDNEYITKAKLQEKDEQLRNMQDQFTAMQSQIQALISSVAQMDQSLEKLARRMFQDGIYKSVIKEEVK